MFFQNTFSKRESPGILSFGDKHQEEDEPGSV
jgi:hypothetical protein